MKRNDVLCTSYQVKALPSRAEKVFNVQCMKSREEPNVSGKPEPRKIYRNIRKKRWKSIALPSAEHIKQIRKKMKKSAMASFCKKLTNQKWNKLIKRKKWAFDPSWDVWCTNVIEDGPGMEKKWLETGVLLWESRSISYWGRATHVLRPHPHPHPSKTFPPLYSSHRLYRVWTVK